MILTGCLCLGKARKVPEALWLWESRQGRIRFQYENCVKGTRGEQTWKMQMVRLGQRHKISGALFVVTTKVDKGLGRARRAGGR